MSVELVSISPIKRLRSREPRPPPAFQPQDLKRAKTSTTATIDSQLIANRKSHVSRSMGGNSHAAQMVLERLR
jgi:hypothetical protein